MKKVNAQLLPTVIWSIVFEYALPFCTKESLIPEIKFFLLVITGCHNWQKILSRRHRATLIFERLDPEQVLQTAYIYDYVSRTMITPGEDKEIGIKFFKALYTGIEPYKQITKERINDCVQGFFQIEQKKLENKEHQNGEHDETLSIDEIVNNREYLTMFINMISLLSDKSIEDYLSSREPYSNKFVSLALYIRPICALVGYQEALQQYRHSFFQEIKVNLTCEPRYNTGLGRHIIIETYFKP